MLTKALLGSALVDIANANKVETGSLFACPLCGARVIAKNGLERAPHFAHFRVADCGATDEMVIEKHSADPVKEIKQMKL